MCYISSVLVNENVGCFCFPAEHTCHCVHFHTRKNSNTTEEVLMKFDAERLYKKLSNHFSSCSDQIDIIGTLHKDLYALQESLHCI